MHSPLLSPDPRLTGMAYGFFCNVINDQYVISHGGDTILFHSGLFLLPEQNVGLFISTNSTGGPKAVEALFQAFMQRYYPPNRLPALAPDADFSSRANLYAGTYYLSRANFTSFEKILMLMNPVSVAVDGNNHVNITSGGETTQFVEVETGLLVSLEHPENKAVMKVENGQVRLHPSAPFVFI